MGLPEKVKEAIERLNPRLRELAEGEVEFVSADPETGEVKLRLQGGLMC